MKINEKIYIVLIIGLILLAWRYSAITETQLDNQSVIDIPDKHPLDETETKAFTLDNGLKVILVSNPKYNISAASMHVKVGSLSDPSDAQ